MRKDVTRLCWMTSLLQPCVATALQLCNSFHCCHDTILLASPRTRVDEQQRRITRLEEELEQQASEPVVATIPGKREDRFPAALPGRLPWHSPDAWTHVSKGMSEEQATAALGQPTSVETFGRYKTLFYRGTVASSGALSGHVNLLDDRVLAVTPPEFADR